MKLAKSFCNQLKKFTNLIVVPKFFITIDGSMFDNMTPFKKWHSLLGLKVCMCTYFCYLWVKVQSSSKEYK